MSIYPSRLSLKKDIPSSLLRGQELSTSIYRPYYIFSRSRDPLLLRLDATSAIIFLRLLTHAFTYSPSSRSHSYTLNETVMSHFYTRNHARHTTDIPMRPPSRA